MGIKFLDESVASEAAAFYEIGTEIDDKVNKYVQELKAGERAKKRELLKEIAAAINLAFSSELFLKSGLEESVRNNTKQHKLDTLFKMQEPDFQELIKEKVVLIRKKSIGNYNETNFNNELRENANVFFQWRYYYEGKVDSLNLEFLRVFSAALYYFYEAQLLSDRNNNK